MSTSHAPIERPVVTEELLRRLDVNGPRYTSYPTADRFVDAFGPDDYIRALEQRAAGGGVIGGASPLSVYVHIPFCESLCYYCACNKVITKHHERAAEYLDALDKEIALHVAHLGAGQPVSQLHFGGGSPTFLSDAELTRVMASLRRAFRIAPGAETSIEVDPRTVNHDRLAHLASLGFNRLSFGVQDFDPAVQHAVHRVQSRESVAALMDSARQLGFESTNVDLIYGLPRQTLESLRSRLRGDLDQMTDEALRRNMQSNSSNLSNVPLHMADVGTDNFQQEFTLALMRGTEVLRERRLYGLATAQMLAMGWRETAESREQFLARLLAHGRAVQAMRAG